MKNSSEVEDHYWLSVIAKSTAFICLHLADLENEGLTTKKEFLQKLGLKRADIASVLGTSDETLRVAEYKQKGKKGKVVGKKK